jgi:hypothetical protein
MIALIASIALAMALIASVTIGNFAIACCCLLQLRIALTLMSRS